MGIGKDNTATGDLLFLAGVSTSNRNRTVDRLLSYDDSKQGYEVQQQHFLSATIEDEMFPGISRSFLKENYKRVTRTQITSDDEDLQKYPNRTKNVASVVVPLPNGRLLECFEQPPLYFKSN